MIKQVRYHLLGAGLHGGGETGCGNWKRKYVREKRKKEKRRQRDRRNKKKEKFKL
jgi:hypothetical protein